METRRERERIRIARFAVAGALALLVLFIGTGLESVASTNAVSSARRAVIVARDTKTTLASTTGGRSRGNPWIASLTAVFGCALLGAYLLRSIRLHDCRRVLRQLSFRLRAPPTLVVAH
jgi:hypothetical protein